MSDELGPRIGKNMVIAAGEKGMAPEELLVSLETVLSIVICYVAVTSEKPDKARLAQELLDTLTERANDRVQTLLKEWK